MSEAGTEGIWTRVSDLLRTKIGATEFDTWFGNADFLGVQEGRALIEVPNRFFVDHITENYGDSLLECVRHVNGDVSEIRMRMSSGPQGELFELPERPANPAEPAAGEPTHRPARIGNLVAKYTFETFVVGKGNQYAHAAALAVAQRPGHQYNPLFIYGGVGLGKTHLINAIAHRVLEKSSEMRVGYLSAESFMNELITAMRQDPKRMEDFRNRFRKLDALILDDVHVLAGREATQEEFFHTFNVLHEARRQIILTSDKTPKDIPNLEERLRSRFEWGLLADVAPPDIETRIAILLRKAEVEEITLPHEVAVFLASKFEGNIRVLEGSLTRLGAMASMSGRPITVEFAREALRDHLQERAVNVSIDLVQKVVSREFNVRPLDLRSAKRTQNLTLPRHIAMYFCRRLTGSSLPAIGQGFGGRDHSTVHHGVQLIERRREEDSAFATLLARIERAILLEVGE